LTLNPFVYFHKIAQVHFQVIGIQYLDLNEESTSVLSQPVL